MKLKKLLPTKKIQSIGNESQIKFLENGCR